MNTTIVRRLYFYAASFVGLQLLAIGARDLLGVLLEQLFEPAAVGEPAVSLARLSASAALVLVGLPLWAVHWAVAQRGAARPDEQHARLRRLYGYAVLLVAALTVLFALRTLLGLLLSAPGPEPTGASIATAVAGLAIYLPLWVYHWRVLSADRDLVETSGGTATLRRWYMAIVLAFGLGAAVYAASGLIDQLLRLAVAPAIGDTSEIGWSAATLVAGLAIWLPHQLWARRLLLAGTPLYADECGSALRRVYLALVITVAAIAGLGGLAALLYDVLLAAFGGALWSSLPADISQPLAVMLVALLVWLYHRGRLGEEARQRDQAAHWGTAQRLIGYLMAAVGLVALYFGAGGLIGTLLRMEFAPATLGVSWRDPLSLYLALALVALPAYSAAARFTEQRARLSAAEDRALSRRIYLYAALLFGLIAAVSTAVLLLRLVILAALGVAEPDLAAEAGRWLGYTLIGAAIAGYHAALVRRAGAARGDIGAGLTIAVLADPPLRDALLAACQRDLPGATLRVAGAGDRGLGLEYLATADALIAPLAIALEGPLSDAIHRFQGQRLLLATAVPGYELIGARESIDALARHAAQRLRGAPAAVPPPAPPVAPPLPRGAA